MSTDLMRFIDYWIGIPLCLSLKFFANIEEIFAFKRKAGRPSDILYIKLSEMGGIILSYPLICKMQEEFPGSQAHFLTFKRNKPIVEALQIIPSENILTIRDDSFLAFIYDTLSFLFRISRKRMDLAFDLELFSRFSAILTYLSGASLRVGYYRYYFEGLYRGNLLTHNFQYNPLLHISESFLSLSQGVREKSKTSPELKDHIKKEEIKIPMFKPNLQDAEDLRKKLSELGIPFQARIFLVNHGDGVIPLREWPLDNFIALAGMLLNDKNNYIIIIGTAGATKKAQAMLSSLDNNRCLDLTDKTTIIELLCLFNISYGLIANDCGLAHIASLTAVKKFIIFGPESPQVYAPLGENSQIFFFGLPCSPCLSTLNHRRSSCRDNYCLKAIRPEDVFRSIQDSIS